MASVSDILRENLQRVRERIGRAAEQAERLPSEVSLVAVTKYVGAELTAALFSAGAEDLGESRPQQLWDKATGSQLTKARWHLIGHLQRNKVRRTLPLVSLLHGVDSERLLSTINDEAAATGATADVLLEVNTSGDAAKHGLDEDGLSTLLEAAPSFQTVKILGLMTMAAREGGPDVARKNFSALREIRDRAMNLAPDCVSLSELSMGMSGDFEQAIQEGATLVRIGSLLWQGVDRSA